MIEVRKLSGSHEMQDSALVTVDGKQGGELTEALLRKYLISEHSPIRSLVVAILITDMSYYTSVHFARHVHTLHYVTSNRPDRTNKGRTINDRVKHKMVVNAQGLIDMMRKRLCSKCAPDTLSIAKQIKRLMMSSHDMDMKVLGEVLVPNCVYRGGCSEFKSCGKAFSQDVTILSLIERYAEYSERFNEEALSC